MSAWATIQSQPMRPIARSSSRITRGTVRVRWVAVSFGGPGSLSATSRNEKATATPAPATYATNGSGLESRPLNECAEATAGTARPASPAMSAIGSRGRQDRDGRIRLRSVVGGTGRRHPRRGR
jgi:hypothetical protein